jgi:hypothetical protein
VYVCAALCACISMFACTSGARREPSCRYADQNIHAFYRTCVYIYRRIYTHTHTQVHGGGEIAVAQVKVVSPPRQRRDEPMQQLM